MLGSPYFGKLPLVFKPRTAASSKPHRMDVRVLRFALAPYHYGLLNLKGT